MRKILGITGIRSDYDIMSGLYRRLAAERSIDFRLLVGGAHLSKTYGYSVDLIRADGIAIFASIESLLDADTSSSRLKSASIFLQTAVDLVAAWKPDVILFAGDREEVWMGGLLGSYLEIPTVHFYGGDQTASWHVDNLVRHAASKLSTFHVVSTQEHRARLLALGEPDSRIRVVGSLALDNFVETAADSGAESSVPRSAGPYALVLFHPDPSEAEIAGDIIRNILLEIRDAGLAARIGYPNTDPSNRSIISVFDEFHSEPKFYFYRNLKRSDFIALYKGARFIIGNSSSGIVEAASIPIPTVNVGMRQRGRYAGRNVLFVDSDRESIRRGITQAQDPEFRASIAGMANPYGDGRSCARAFDLIMSTNFARLLPKVEDPLELNPGSVPSESAQGIARGASVVSYWTLSAK